MREIKFKIELIQPINELKDFFGKGWELKIQSGEEKLYATLFGSCFDPDESTNINNNCLVSVEYSTHSRLKRQILATTIRTIGLEMSCENLINVVDKVQIIQEEIGVEKVEPKEIILKKENFIDDNTYIDNELQLAINGNSRIEIFFTKDFKSPLWVKFTIGESVQLNSVHF